jgi:hypothetical protein
MTEPVTKISVRLGTTVNLGDFENIRLDVEVQDHVRSVDKSTGAAIDRVYSLVEAKLAEKLQPYKDA